MVGHDPALPFIHQGFPFAAQQEFVERVIEVLARHLCIASTCRSQRRLVHQVFQVGSREAWCRACQVLQVDIRRQGDLTRMDAQDGFAPTSFRQIHRDLPVETPRPQQGGIEHVRAVRGGQHHNGIARLEAIQLHEQLLQRLFTLIIARKRRGATARSPDRVELVDKDDAGSVLLGLLKQVAYAAGSHADEQFDKAGRTGAEERDTSLTCDCTCEQGLPRAWRTDQQHPFGNVCPNRQVALWIAQEVDHLAQVLLGFVDTRHIVEGRRWTLFVVQFGAAAPHSKDASPLLRLPHVAQEHVAKVNQQQDG